MLRIRIEEEITEIMYGCKALSASNHRNIKLKFRKCVLTVKVVSQKNTEEFVTLNILNIIVVYELQK